MAPALWRLLGAHFVTRRRVVISAMAVAVVVVAATGLVLWRIDQPGEAPAGHRAAQQGNWAASGLTACPSGGRPATYDTLRGLIDDVRAESRGSGS